MRRSRPMVWVGCAPRTHSTIRSTPSVTRSMTESRDELVLATAVRAMAPIAEWLLHEGVTYPRLASALKQTFLDAAQKVLQDGAGKVNDSSISVLSGIHRKDVREWRLAGRPRARAKITGAAMQVFTRWVTDPEYCDEQGRPRVLNRAGGPGSFEALATSTLKDVHPLTLLRELARLGIVRQAQGESEAKEDKVCLCVDAFVPKEGVAEMLQLFADNVGDHAAAATHNVMGGTPPMLEQSVYANGLTPESVSVLNALAREIWSNALREFARKATVLDRQDKGKPNADRRVRFGMYYYRGQNGRLR